MKGAVGGRIRPSFEPLTVTAPQERFPLGVNTLVSAGTGDLPPAQRLAELVAEEAFFFAIDGEVVGPAFVVNGREGLGPLPVQ